jgi:hypothetical protein
VIHKVILSLPPFGADEKEPAQFLFPISQIKHSRGIVIHLFKKNLDAENPNKHFHCLKVTYHDNDGSWL